MMSVACRSVAVNNVTPFPGTNVPETEKKALPPLPPCDPNYRASTNAEIEKEKEKAVTELTSSDEINRLVRYFLDKDDVRDALIVVVQFNTGLRISDTLALTWKDIMKDEFITTLQKTNTKHYVYPNRAVHTAAELYRKVSGLPCRPNDFIFTSNSGHKGHVPLLDRRRRVVAKQHTTEVQPLRAENVSRIMTKAGKETGLATKYRRISSHTGRKTHANALAGTFTDWDIGSDLERRQSRIYLAQCALGHAKADTTTGHYLNDTVRKEACYRMNFGLEPVQEYIKRKGIVL